MENLISVIIPVYKVEKFLCKCIDSVLNQTYHNLEVILVDDGSPDNCPLICDRYSNIDNRIKVIHQENKGLSMARNAGLDYAHGEYIAFLDSDDCIESRMYEILLNLSLKHDADISICDTNFVTEIDSSNLNQLKIDAFEEKIFTAKELVDGLFTQEKIRFEVWNKLWKKELIGDVRFKEGQVCEDVYFDRVLFLRSKKAVHINLPLYNYLTQRVGNTNSSFKTQKLCVFNEFECLIEDLRQKHLIDSIELIRCVATDFAVSFYEEAIRANQEKIILKELKKYFYKFYKFGAIYKHETKKHILKKFLFYLNPYILTKIYIKTYKK